ncbi:MAG: hypothetical protein WC454_05495 [Phycisphaerae bacterium]|jgi:hypothetical protein
MNDSYFCNPVLAHGGFYLRGGSVVFLLTIMALFVFGPLLFRKSFRMPKGLFVSSFISCIIILFSIFILSFNLPVPIEVAFPFYAVISLYCPIIRFMDKLLPDWGWYVTHWELILYLIAFIINTLAIFAIIRLFLFLRLEDSTKKPQAKQTDETENSPVKSADL